MRHPIIYQNEDDFVHDCGIFLDEERKRNDNYPATIKAVMNKALVDH
jgi:hypothetical protein